VIHYNNSYATYFADYFRCHLPFTFSSDKKSYQTSTLVQSKQNSQYFRQMMQRCTKLQVFTKTNLPADTRYKVTYIHDM